MKKVSPARIASVLVVLGTLALMSVAAQLSSAQKKGDPGSPAQPPPASNQPRPGPTGTDVSGANQSFFEMELLLTGKSLETDMERNRRQLAAQVDLDFRRLEQLNNEQIAPLLRAAPLDKKPDYKKLARAAAEIKDRATRIKYNIPLSLKKKGEKIRYEAHTNELDSMVPELSGLIKSFIGNPVFHERDRNDAELRSTAGHDLEGIIKLSGTINKMAKWLAKASTRSA